MGLCYILKPANVHQKSVYKIGKTTRSMKHRLQGYPKGSIVIKSWDVTDCHTIEKVIIKKFKSKYKLAQGLEYFEGNLDDMVQDIETIIAKIDRQLNVDIDNKNDQYAHRLGAIEEYDCVCGKKFKSESGMYRHRKKCKIYSAVYRHDELLDAYNALLDENSNLKADNAKLAADNTKLADVTPRNSELSKANMGLSMEVKRLNELIYHIMKDKIAAKNNQISDAESIINTSTKTLMTLLNKSTNIAP